MTKYVENFTIVACVACGANRSDVWEKCFCGETRTKPGPPVDSPLEDKLFSYEREKLLE